MLIFGINWGLYNAYIRRLQKALSKFNGICDRKMKNKSLAEDLVSQTMITAIEKLGEGLSANDLTAWCHSFEE